MRAADAHLRNLFPLLCLVLAGLHQHTAVGLELSAEPDPPRLIAPCPASKLDMSAWVPVQQDRFTFQLPPGFHEVQLDGDVDSWVRQFESADSAVFVSFDWGWYSNPLKEGEPGQLFRACEERIGGRPARVITLWPMDGLPRGRFGAGAAWRDVRPRVHLTFFGWAPDSSGVGQLLGIFRTVRFKEPR